MVPEQIDYRVLGPLEVVRSGRSIDIHGPRLRALLIILLLSANRPVSRDALIHKLWGDHPPAGARTSLDVYIWRLRKALEAPADRQIVVTRPGAYCLLASDEQIDSRRFERMVAEAQSAFAAGRGLEAAGLLRAALRLWRGNALSDLRDEPFARPEITRLEEMRLGAIEDRIDADLAACRHADVVSELDALVAKHPLRERLHGQLMIALYRSGRQAEALEAYQSARRRLLDELGLEPGPALQRLEQAILRQDAGLELPVIRAVPVSQLAAAGPNPVRPQRVLARFWRRPVPTAGTLTAAAVLAGGLLLGFWLGRQRG